MAINPLSTGPDEFAKAVNEFGIHLYQTIKEARDGENMFFSPLSISTAMAMTHLGARGDTAKQIADVFRFNKIDGELHQAFKKMDDALFRPDQETGEGSRLFYIPQRQPRYHFLAAANRLYAKTGSPFLRSFMDDTARFYDSGIEAVDDFTSPSAIKSINDWVSERTEGKINNVLDVGMLDSLTRLVLVNSMYFKGTWDEQFIKTCTTQDFFKKPGSKKRISTYFMRMKKAEHWYVLDTDLKCKVLCLRFDHNINVSMMIALPDKADGLPGLESKLSAETIHGWIAERRLGTVNVFLPKFTISTQVDLKEALKSMGVYDAFDGSRADLSGITGTRDLELSALIHKTFVDVNEEGCEAAAVTVEPVMLYTMCDSTKPPKPVEFRADHPFLFFLIHNLTHAIIFIGRLVDPSKEKNEDCHLQEINTKPSRCTCS